MYKKYSNINKEVLQHVAGQKYFDDLTFWLVSSIYLSQVTLNEWFVIWSWIYKLYARRQKELKKF